MRDSSELFRADLPIELVCIPLKFSKLNSITEHGTLELDLLEFQAYIFQFPLVQLADSGRNAPFTSTKELISLTFEH
ncbi:hypothetical protein GZH49_40340, partial [Nocardia terpenica]|uniref:hypothetical protein n=1 Tax=Nocardia terpenica TaxID=455432 RepID=UPI002FDF46DB